MLMMLIVLFCPSPAEASPNIISSGAALADSSVPMIMASTNPVLGGIPIFTDKSWPIIMFWYKVLAGLSGAFIFLMLIKTGYQYMFSAVSNPGMKAGFMHSIERTFVALLIIMVAPMFIGLLVEVNDSIVGLFSNTINSLGVHVDQIGIEGVSFDSNFINKMIAWPIKLIFIDLPNKIFELRPLSHIIFNGETNILDPNIFMGKFQSGDDFDLGDPLASVVVSLVFVVFNLVFNAMYTIRMWVVIAVLCATPIIVWIWALSSQATIIEMWLSELFQTIFMQTWHALTFAIVITVLLYSNGASMPTAVDTSSVTTLLISIGQYVAGFAGVICVGVIIFSAYRMVVATIVKGDEEELIKNKYRVQKALIGLIIVSLSLMIASSIFPKEVNILQPTITGGGDHIITIWQIFFAFFVILPISKMFSNIFMSIVARIGTVDEQGLAMGATTGMIGGLAALGAATAKGAGGTFMEREHRSAHSGSGGSSGGSRSGNTPPIAPSSTSSDTPGSPRSESNNIFTGENPSTLQEAGGSQSYTPSQNFGFSEDGGSYDTGRSTASNYGSNNNQSPGIVPIGQNPYSDNAYESESNNIDDVERPTFQQLLRNAGAEVDEGIGSSVGDAATTAITTLGYVAGSVVGQGEAFSRVTHSLGGKQAGNLIKTFAVGKNVYNSVKGESRAETMNNLQAITGRSSARGAVVHAVVSAHATLGKGSVKADEIGSKIGGFIDAKK